MLNKNDVLTLRDFALSHLPKVQRQADIAYDGGGRRAEMQAIAFAPVGVPYSRRPTAIELQAARLLHLVGKHPDTHTERLNEDADGDDFPGELAALLEADAERDRKLTDQLLLVEARELSRLSGAALPPCIGNSVDILDERNVAPVGIARTTRHKLRTNSLDVPIKKAIAKANSIATGAVYLELRDLALSGESPFTGAFDGDALCYTNDKNESAKLTKDALSKRLKSHSL